MTQRVYNFSPGPAVLPEPVLAEVQRDMMALPGAGASILEISHRSSTFKAIIEQAETNLRQLLAIPDNYTVLFLQGGARLQFSMVPMNLMSDAKPSADYIQTGSWSKNAAKEAVHAGKVHMAWDGSKTNFDRLPADGDLDLDPNAAYAYFASNETIQGVQFPTEPKVGDVPLVCDASSDFLSRPIDIKKYGIYYACTQKNAGPAGLAIVIIRNDLLERSRENLPGYLNYQIHVKEKSLWNTPNTFAIYVVSLVTKWLLTDIGGLAKMAARNQAKAAMLYKVIDTAGGFYAGHAQPRCRSVMNVAFRLPNDELTAKFLAEAAKRDLTELKGHRSVGGVRASIYNAMPVAGVEKLRDFMLEFHEANA
jgi:phosphoserine aminotransferase